MSLALPTSPMPSRRPGRPPLSSDPRYRELHLTAAEAWLLHGRPASTVMGAFRISRTTLWRWVRLALAYDCPRAYALRRLTGRDPLP